MNKEYKDSYIEKLSKLTEKEQRLRDLQLSKMQGPLVGYPTFDKPWLKYYTEKSINTDMPKMSAYKYLYECNKDYMDNIALSYYGKKLTFRELFDNIEKTAKALKAMGVEENEKITISMPNTPEAIISFYALNKIGVIANMIHPLSAENEIKYFINVSKSSYIVTINVSCGK